MAYREISEEDRINATQEVIACGIKDRKVLAEIAEKYGVSIETLLIWIKKITDNVPGVLKKEKPGPKPDKNVNTSKVTKSGKNKNNHKEEQEHDIEDKSCPNCGSNHVVKNGRCKINNWFRKSLFTFLFFLLTNKKIKSEAIMQKYYCKNCFSSIKDDYWVTNNDIRDAIKVEIVKLICKLRFKHGLSNRIISDIIKEQYGFNYSVGYISQICSEAAERALTKLLLLNEVSQKEGKMIIMDETFPKTIYGTVKIGVIVDENGLIRGVKLIFNKKKDLKKLIEKVLEGGQFNPKYFMSDYDKTYPNIIKDILPNIIIMKDFVHALRKFNKDLSAVLSKVEVKGIKNLTKKRQKEIKRLKKRLLRKLVKVALYKFILAFKFKNAPVGSLYIEAGLSELKKLVEQYSSMSSYYDKVEKYINEFIDTWVRQMEICYKENLPLTSNAIESVNSVLKKSSKISKSFYNNRKLECHFAAICLMENFDIKKRGKNKGTNAVMRAGIDLEEYGAQDFYEAINVTEIALGKGKTCNVNVDLKKLLHKTA